MFLLLRSGGAELDVRDVLALPPILNVTPPAAVTPSG
jgi:hypothetical protein